MVLRCSSIAHLAHFSLLLGFPSAVAGVTVHDHSSGHSVANPHGCKSGLRRALWVVIEIEIDVAATPSQWDDKDGGTAMRWDASGRIGGCRNERWAGFSAVMCEPRSALPC